MKSQAAVEARGRALVALVEAVLPVTGEVHDDSDAWPLVGAALVSRATGIMASILELYGSKRRSGPEILLRSLYEHTVCLAWLAADPSASRIAAWRKSDLSSRLKADKEWRERGVSLLEDDLRAQMEREVVRLEGGPLVLADLAVVADEAWSGKIPGIDEQAKTSHYSFRGQYAVIYRYTSTTAHPSFTGINLVVTHTSATGREVALEEDVPVREWDPVASATLVFGHCLFVAGASLGWPAGEHVDAIFKRF